MKNIRYFFIAFLFILFGCTKQAQAIPPTFTAVPPTATILPTGTATEAPTATPIASMPPDPTADPTIFGVIGQSEIQAFALESVANAIFKKTFDGFVADGRIQEYQVMRVAVFPGSGGLLSEITFNVRTNDSTWVESDGTQAADNWINGKCYRFDFFTTETEFQLKNRRTCG
jgi:hypothetical protein